MIVPELDWQAPSSARARAKATGLRISRRCFMASPLAARRTGRAAVAALVGGENDRRRAARDEHADHRPEPPAARNRGCASTGAGCDTRDTAGTDAATGGVASPGGGASCASKTTRSRSLDPGASSSVRRVGVKPFARTETCVVPAATRNGLASGRVPIGSPFTRISAPSGEPQTSSVARWSRTKASDCSIVVRCFAIQGSAPWSSPSCRCFSAAAHRPSACSAKPV